MQTYTWTQERKQVVAKLWMQGLKARDIAEKIGVSKNAIIGIVNRMNLQRTEQRRENGKRIVIGKKHHCPYEERRQLTLLSKQCRKNIYQIAEVMNMDVYVVVQKLRSLELPVLRENEPQITIKNALFFKRQPKCRHETCSHQAIPKWKLCYTHAN